MRVPLTARVLNFMDACYVSEVAVAVLVTAGLEAEIICGALVRKCVACQEYCSSSCLLKLLCLTVVPSIFL